MNPRAPAMRALTNVAIRGLILGSRFLLLFALAQLVPPEVLGEFGLLSATLGFGVLVVGADFYTYSTRELLRNSRSEWPNRIRDHFALSSIGYTLALPLFSLLFLIGALPARYVWWCLPLLIVEHLGQELSRLLVALGRPLLANVTLFFRSGAWVWATIAIMFLRPSTRHLHTVLSSWLLASTLAVIIGGAGLRRLPWRELRPGVDWPWVRWGLRTALKFFVATLCLRAMFTLDRYFVEWSAGPELLGAYTLYVGAAVSIIAFLDSGVFAFLYPTLVESYHQRSFSEFEQTMRRMWRQTMWSVLLLAILGFILIGPLTRLLANPLYHEHTGIFLVLLLAVSIYALSMVPHYGLYAFRSDSLLLYSQAIGLVSFAVAAPLLRGVLPFASVAIGLLVGLSAMGLLKTVAYSRCRRALIPSDPR